MAETESAFREAVLQTWEAWGSSMEQGDAERWISLWVPDGVQMAPNVPTRHGAAEILEGMKSSLQRGSYSDVTIDLEEARAAADIGYARGNARYTFTKRSGEGSSRVDAKYLTVFLRLPDGTWKVYCDCVNLNRP